MIGPYFCINTLRPRQDGRCFVDNIFKRIFLNEKYGFQLKFHWSLFLRVQLTISKHWLRSWLFAELAQYTIWTSGGPVHWRINATLGDNELTHWGRVTHICVSKLTIIGSNNGLLPDRRQAISFKKMHLKMSSGKWRPSCLGLNVLMALPAGRLPITSGFPAHDKTSYCKISKQSLEAARFVFRIVRSLWNLTGTSAAGLPKCLSNFKAMR